MILLGLPGAGKGTQAARLSETIGFAHITTGELFRENVRQGTELGEKARPYVERGLLVPDEITVGMLLERIAKPDCAGGALLDGYPRNLEQARALDAALSRRGAAIDRVVYIEVPTDELVRRLAGRWTCPQCGAVYHETSNPPARAGVCDSCGARLYQREDDRPEVVRTRLEVNLAQLEPLLRYYGEQGKLVEVEGQQGIEGVSRDLAAVLERTETG
ncbi:MAG TPA: adenylate kinase [Dehalococcoidia bacterium]|nr:adenylate kinase [Dehalococcoidia bacterium]